MLSLRSKITSTVVEDPSLHFSQVIRESRSVVASDSGRGDFMNLVRKMAVRTAKRG